MVRKKNFYSVVAGLFGLITLASCAGNGVREIDKDLMQGSSVRVISGVMNREIQVQRNAPDHYPLFAYFDHIPPNKENYDASLKGELGDAFLYMGAPKFQSNTNLIKGESIVSLAAFSYFPAHPLYLAESLLFEGALDEYVKSRQKWIQIYSKNRADISFIEKNLPEFLGGEVMHKTLKSYLSTKSLFGKMDFRTADFRYGKQLKGNVKKIKEDFLIVVDTGFYMTNDTAAVELVSEYYLYETLTGKLLRQGKAVYFSNVYGRHLVPITSDSRSKIIGKIKNKYDLGSASGVTERVQLSSKIRKEVQRLDKRLELVGEEQSLKNLWTDSDSGKLKAALQEGVEELSAMISAELEGTVCKDASLTARIEEVEPDNFRCLLYENKGRRRERLSIGRESLLISYINNWYPASALYLDWRHIANP
ncbi:hypothetical protein MJO52_19510 [Microbulbifer variabilis]|uniref:Lipoprotein n=1 Tax=Microbulbifer variabilis TaxID=266805 RepID=A0ABY4VAC4_9GAMM|nr:hypothetical protein [Microbulbifer variabilis]USD21223.1 hypothetical protein MJO52_19510 [Microbulbifer variabilis]